MTRKPLRDRTPWVHSELIRRHFPAARSSHDSHLPWCLGHRGRARAVWRGTRQFNTLFTLYGYPFAAEAATTTLTFTDTSSVTDNIDGLLALVSADTAPTGEVPEPSSFALIGVGLAGMGARRAVRRLALRLPVGR